MQPGKIKISVLSIVLKPLPSNTYLPSWMPLEIKGAMFDGGAAAAAAVRPPIGRHRLDAINCGRSQLATAGGQPVLRREI